MRKNTICQRFHKVKKLQFDNFDWIGFQDEEDTEWILLNDRDEDDDLINEDSQNDEVSI